MARPAGRNASSSVAHSSLLLCARTWKSGVGEARQELPEPPAEERRSRTWFRKPCRTPPTLAFWKPFR